MSKKSFLKAVKEYKRSGDVITPALIDLLSKANKITPSDGSDYAEDAGVDIFYGH